MPLLVLGVLAAAVLALLALVVCTAILSRHEVRRQQATAVLDRLISALPGKGQAPAERPPSAGT